MNSVHISMYIDMYTYLYAHIHECMYYIVSKYARLNAHAATAHPSAHPDRLLSATIWRASTKQAAAITIY